MRMRTDLSETIVGDLRTVALPAASYDVAFSTFVLEHVTGAEQVLDRMVAAIRPGGLLLVRIPDRDSVFGFITRHSRTGCMSSTCAGSGAANWLAHRDGGRSRAFTTRSSPGGA